jgi:hypothetical protein
MGNIKVQFNIRPEVNELISLAAAKRGITRSQYVQDLVRAAASRRVS